MWNKKSKRCICGHEREEHPLDHFDNWSSCSKCICCHYYKGSGDEKPITKCMFCDNPPLFPFAGKEVPRGVFAGICSPCHSRIQENRHKDSVEKYKQLKKVSDKAWEKE